jgi:hypothetical protein
MKRKAVIAATFGRAGVWLIVVVWCFAPFLWMAIMFVFSIGQGGPNQPAMGPMPMANQGLLLKLMSSTFMIGAFLYGIWCAVGVAMGFGLDRAITVGESLAALGADGPLFRAANGATAALPTASHALKANSGIVR